MPRIAMTQEQTADMRGRILREAGLIAAEDGIGALSMRHLASRLGITAGALYRYFPSREDLILRHFGSGMDALYEHLTAASAASADPLAALRAYAMAYADFALSDPVRFRLMFLQNNPETQNAREIFASVGAAYDGFVARMADAIADRAIADGDAKEKTDVLWAGIHGAVTLLINAPEMEFGAPRAFVERTVDTLLVGLARTGAGR